MATTSVKMREADKERLDRLQAEVTARMGAKVSQQDLLADLLDLAERRLDELAPKPKRAAKGAIRRLLALPLDAGVTSREEDVDAALYGRER